MTSKAIFIEWRNSRTKEEKEVYGMTEVNGDVAKIYMRRRQCSRELVDTFFHEMTHVFFAFHKKNKHMTDEQEEWLASKLGNVAAELLR